MNRSRTAWQARLVGSLAALVLASSAFSGGLYRWTDADGQVHFSDQPPAVGAYEEVQRLATPRFVDPGIPDGHYSVTEQWQRMRTERQARQDAQRERARQARELALREREVAASERAAEQASTSGAVSSPVWIVPRRPGHHYRPHHPPARPLPGAGLWKPDHPAFRPPLRPQPRPGSGPGGVDRHLD
jgi:hypothetical protein